MPLRVPDLNDDLSDLEVLPSERVCPACHLTHNRHLTACPSLECSAGTPLETR